MFLPRNDSKTLHLKKFHGVQLIHPMGNRPECSGYPSGTHDPFWDDGPPQCVADKNCEDVPLEGSDQGGGGGGGGGTGGVW